MKIVYLLTLMLAFTVSDSGAVLVSNVGLFSKLKHDYTNFQSLDITYNTTNRILCISRCLELSGLCYSFIYQPDSHYCELGYKLANSTTSRNMSVDIFEVEKSGTSAKSTDKCKTDLRTTSTGEIKSPLYPNNYPNNTCSVWLIQAGSMETIILKIAGVNTDCGFDFLTVYDGGDVGAPKLFRGCSIQKEFSISSSSNTMYVTFITNNDVTDQGFLATYSFYSISVSLTGDGNVYSPGYPTTDYPNNFRCSWTLQAPTGLIALLTIHTLATECNMDNFIVYDGNSDKAPKIFQRCNVLSDVEVYSSSSTLYFTFTSNKNITNKGFSLTYGIYDCDDSRYCPSTTYWTTIELAREIERINLNCSYSISVESDSIIIFHILDLSLNCTQDYFKVYDGTTSKAASLFNDCQVNPTFLLASSSSTLFVTYTENDNVKGNGFRFTYMQYVYKCGGAYQANSYFQSPLYPHNYPTNFQCSWKFTAPAGYTVTLNLQTLDIECPFDFFTIYDGHDASAPMLLRSCSALSITRTTTTNAMYITFTSDDKNTREGWYGTLSQTP